MERERFLTVAEVARELKVSAETVRRWLRAGRLRGVLLGGDKAGYRIPSAELERFLEAVV
jgi:excisionase family DNA binding protein